MNVIKISKIEPSNLDQEILEFAPIECMDCNCTDNIQIQYFLVTPAVETEDEQIELQRIVKKELGHDKFTDMYCDLGQIISITHCSQCGSKNIFMDF